MTDLRQAAQQAEPFAWAVQGITQMLHGEFAELDAKSKARRIGGTCVAYPLYTTPPAAQPKQQAEPVADGNKVICPACCHQFRAIPTAVQTLMLNAGFEPPFVTPPAAERKPLTEEKIGFECRKHFWMHGTRFEDAYKAGFRDSEAAHGIKEGT